MTIVIPSDNPDSLNACVDAIFRNEPFVRKEDIVAVVDGDFGPYRVWYINLHKPFCFARSVNAGFSAASLRKANKEVVERMEYNPTSEGGLIILNHDAILETPGGLSSLITKRTEEYGVVSAAIRGACCNPLQEAGYGDPCQALVSTDVTVAFVCVYIPQATIDRIGLLDQRLTGYGYDDDLYCTQVRAAGLKVGIWHGCVVEHGSLPSSFRSRPDCREKMDYNHKLYHEIIDEKGLRAHSTHHNWCREFGNDPDRQ